MSRVIRTSPSVRTIVLETLPLDNLPQRGGDYLDQVRAAAAEIVAAAQAEAVLIKRRAAEEALATAHAQAEQIADEKLSQQVALLMPALREAAQAIQAAKAQWLAHWEQAAVAVSTAIAERIIRRELDRAPEITLALVKEALELAAGSPEVKLRMHPDDLEALGDRVGQLAAELARTGTAEIIADARIERGGCRVDTRFGSVDQQFSAQLARIDEELK